MPTVYVARTGAVVRKIDERLRVTHEKETLLDVPLLRVDDVVAFGRVTVTTAAIESLLERNISMAFLSERGRYLGRLEPAFSKNCFLRKAQYEACFCPHRSLSLAREFVAAKIANQRTYLVRANRERKQEKLQEAIALIKKLERRLQTADEHDALLGMEGAAAAAYFGVFGDLIQNEAFSFEKRTRRPPQDPVNALLSLGYALLANDFTGLLTGIGFDPYVGYLHRHAYGRASLALDLMEEFRPIIVDSVVLSCLNKGVMNPEHFEHQAGGAVRLNEEGRIAFLRQYEQRKRTELKHPTFGNRLSYLRCMELQARLLGKCIQGELESYPSFRTR